MSETRIGSIRRVRFIVLILMVIMMGILAAAAQVHAASWHDVYLTPGQTYDVSTAESNTTVYIDKAGDYTLKGESTQCRVVIQSGGVNVYLADGLDIDPGALANVGLATAGIIVEDQGGTVKLISKKDADIYIGGYLEAAAIEKPGRVTELVFETEDINAPGTITAYRSGASLSAAIGSSCLMVGRTATGNIVINSGNIVATGGNQSAGIGGGNSGHAYDIYINGGNVRAESGPNGTGIGGGYHGSAQNIQINGGVVYAKGTRGAGIGSGEQSEVARDVIIKGGAVIAYSTAGAAIGGGERSDVINLRIEGGVIEARSDATGIGSTADQHLGNLESLYITGGTITVHGDFVGIGASTAAPGPNNIYISGGDITVTSDYYAIGGGGFSSVLDDVRMTTVYVSGGTINANGGKCDFGTNTTWMNLYTVITGGSVYANYSKMMNVVRDVDFSKEDPAGIPVYRTAVTLEGAPDKWPVSSTKIVFEGQQIEYGVKDTRSDSAGKVYLWLPVKGEGGEMVKSEVTSVGAGGVVYYGNIKAGETGTLSPATRILLYPDTDPGDFGVAYVAEGNKKFDIMSQPEINDGKKVIKYVIFGSNIEIADAEGNFYPNVVSNIDAVTGDELAVPIRYTDDEGRWLQDSDRRIKLRAIAITDGFGDIIQPGGPEDGADGDTGTGSDELGTGSDELGTGGNEVITGDDAPIGLIAGIMLAALGGAATVLFGRRRRTE